MPRAAPVTSTFRLVAEQNALTARRDTTLRTGTRGPGVTSADALKSNEAFAVLLEGAQFHITPLSTGTAYEQQCGACLMCFTPASTSSRRRLDDAWPGLDPSLGINETLFCSGGNGDGAHSGMCS